MYSGNFFKDASIVSRCIVPGFFHVLKNEHFTKDFNELYDIIEISKNKNIELAKIKIHESWKKFNNKFNEITFFASIGNIVGFFEDKCKGFLDELKYVDIHVYETYNRTMNEEKQKLSRIQKEIDNLNNRQLDKINDLINSKEFILVFD